MQSSTAMSETGLQSCFVEIGKWAYGRTGRAQEVYSELYGLYLTQSAGMATRAVQRVTTTARPPRQARNAARTAPAANRQRTRTTPGTPGPKDALVLAKIVATPNPITIEPLRKYFENPARKMSTNILGTAISRLLKAGYITGTPKVGPFTATTTGVEAARKVTSISSRRRASSRGSTTPTTQPVSEQQQATG